MFSHLESYTRERNFILTKTAENAVQGQEKDHQDFLHNH